MTTFYGTVVFRTLNKGSKSERLGACLRTRDGKEFTLLRRGENLFADPELEALAGKTVVCDGDVSEGYLFVTRIAEVS